MNTKSGLADFVDGRPRERRLDHAELTINLACVARELGYTDGLMPEPIRAAVETALTNATPLINARTLWLPLPCQVDSHVNTMTVADTTFAVGKMVRAHLHRASAVALFVVTIGPAVEEQARAMMKDGRMMEGYALDAVGSSAAEASADSVEADIRAAAQAAGWKATNRLSPGYCAWATAEQQKLIGLLPDEPCGIRLSKSSLMWPIKSVSGVIGLGPDVKHLDYMCSTCDLIACHKRRSPPPATA
ncbi:MAG: hypothetical protein JSV19_03145 [Phycisphaerales bacterium]|nr:MAG: hypothetical protein JSV19_03145 [Phycisphaerales bacterium]